MARFVDYNPKQTVLLPISFDQQLLPGTFEHTLVYLVDNKLLTSAIFNPPATSVILWKIIGNVKNK